MHFLWDWCTHTRNTHTHCWSCDQGGVHARGDSHKSHVNLMEISCRFIGFQLPSIIKTLEFFTRRPVLFRLLCFSLSFGEIVISFCYLCHLCAAQMDRKTSRMSWTPAWSLWTRASGPCRSLEFSTIRNTAQVNVSDSETSLKGSSVSLFTGNP